ncbi:ATP synthase F1 subunit gamma [Oceanotoga teriensis]|uniref:ATP synthase F1 subunit gamma n=1 Tax=Oceanotoga teriensis TaxID=515440 RepID=UPI0027126F94|nr:ATP synthase F1 subunit gamma [Oceanotoga teriensis]MDO7976709.1 ATP synthase F1 subunit gamma [Oceanotoga teriensis]
MSKGKLRIIKKRIDSTRSTMQITKAMQMVASARLNKIKKGMQPIRDYAKYAKNIIEKIEPDINSPFVKDGSGTLLVVITPDMGLGGSFASDISTFAKKESEKTDDFKGFLVIGNRGSVELKKTNKILLSRVNLFDTPKKEHAEYILDDILEFLEKEDISKVKVIYGELKNALIQKPKIVDLLPIQYENSLDPRYEYEPDSSVLFEEASYLYMLSQIFLFIYETKISELHARQNAMKNATENAENLISDLNLEYNKMRQASITSELIDIVNGAQALQDD